MENKFSLNPDTILRNLKNHSDDAEQFLNLVSDFYCHHPASMLNNDEIKNFIINSQWFNTPEAFVETLKVLNQRHAIRRHRIVRYFGVINSDEEFWFKLASIDISLAKYYNKPTDAYRAYVAIME